MEMPFFGKDQPSETYYYTPETINVFGIVDCNQEKEAYTVTAMANSMVARAEKMLHCS